MKRLLKSQLEWLTAVALWLRCLFTSWFGSLPAVVEPAILLNIHARNGADRNEKKAIYELKNHLVRLLYEQGYCVAASNVVQELPCWGTWNPCWGTWNYDCGPYCRKCGGTGVYRRHELIRFTFVVNDQRFTWHQPAGLVDWTVDFTKEKMDVYEEGGQSDQKPFEDNEKALHTAVYKVWWALFRHGRAPKLPLFNHLRFYHWRTAEIYYPQTEEWFFLGATLRHTWRGYKSSTWELYWPQIPHWELLRGNWGRGGVETAWHGNWFGLGVKREDGRWGWSLILFGRFPIAELRREWRYRRARYLCWRRGHNWRPRASWAGGRWCVRCCRIEED